MGRSNTNIITLYDYLKALKKDENLMMELRRKRDNKFLVGYLSDDNRIGIVSDGTNEDEFWFCSIKKFEKEYRITKIIDSDFEKYNIEQEVEELE